MYQYGGHMEDTENKQMKRAYSKLLYRQRNKDEAIISVMKRMFGEHLMSGLIRIQNRDLSFQMHNLLQHAQTDYVTL
jgi:hypothetical protein